MGRCRGGNVVKLSAWDACGWAVAASVRHCSSSRSGVKRNRLRRITRAVDAVKCESLFLCQELSVALAQANPNARIEPDRLLGPPSTHLPFCGLGSLP